MNNTPDQLLDPEDFDALTAPEKLQDEDEAHDEEVQRELDERFRESVTDSVVDTLGDMFKPGFMGKDQA